jgi:hypothetical protein
MRVPHPCRIHNPRFTSAVALAARVGIPRLLALVIPTRERSETGGIRFWLLTVTRRFSAASSVEAWDQALRPALRSTIECGL